MNDDVLIKKHLNVTQCNNPCDFFIGKWKRYLEWRLFGEDFQIKEATHRIVIIEEFHSNTIINENDNIRYLKWSFGNNIDNVDFGYVMKFSNDPNADPNSGDMIIEWQYSGQLCKGIYRPKSALAILNFYLTDATITITYRIIDEHTLAVTIIDVSSIGQYVQIGNMIRLTDDDDDNDDEMKIEGNNGDDQQRDDNDDDDIYELESNDDSSNIS